MVTSTILSFFSVLALIDTSVLAQGTGGVLSPIDMSVPSWTIVRPYNNPEDSVIGPDKMYSELKENDIYFAFYFDVYEKTNAATDDFHTGKEPYYTLSCWIQRKEGENTPSHYVLSAQSPWVSGDFGDNLELICPKSEYKCNRDKCEGEYALPTDDINTSKM